MLPEPDWTWKWADEKNVLTCWCYCTCSWTYMCVRACVHADGCMCLAGTMKRHQRTCRPWPSRVRILRHSIRQSSAKAANRTSSAATVGGMNCWAL